MTEQRIGRHVVRAWAGRWVPVGTGVILVMGLVALGSRRLPGSGPSRPPVVMDLDLQQALTNFFVTGGAIGAVIVLVGLFWPGREPLDLPRRSLARYVVGPLIIIGAVGLLFLFPRPDAEPPVQSPSGETVVDSPAPASDGEPPVWGFYALVGALGLALVIVGRRARADAGSADAPGPDGASGPDPAVLFDLPDGYVPGGDSRSQVIGSYVDMMGAFARRRLGRVAAETPREFLARAAGPVPGAARPAARLTELFELARFSHHTVTAGEADESRRALNAVRAALDAGE